MPHSLATYLLNHSDGGAVPLVPDPALLVAPAAGRAGGHLLVPNGTRVNILEDAATSVRVAVAAAGRHWVQGWVPSAWLRPADLRRVA